MIHYLHTVDVKLLLWLNSFHTPFFDRLMFFISGVPQWIPFYLLLVFLIFYKFRKKGWMFLGLVIVVFALTDFTSVHLFKNVFLRLRPSRNSELEGLVHLVNGYKGGMYGFISSHAANTFGLAVSMCFIFRKGWVTAGMLTWASVVSYSRIYLGVHYPFDVLCGALWGSLVAWMMYLALNAIRNKLNERKAARTA
jgi:undecaprenyl-diphosphatase